MSNKFSMDDYIDVAERIMHFNEKYPDGSLQTVDWTVSQVGEQTFVVYRAAAFRHPEDPRPGHGVAWEPFPGATPYTKNSELMNAETAAWGRAIIACGLTSNRKIASKQEVRARRQEQETVERAAAGSLVGSSPPAEQSQNGYATAEDQRTLVGAAKGLTVRQIKLALGSVGSSFPEKGELFSMVPKGKTQQLSEILAGIERDAIA